MMPLRAPAPLLPRRGVLAGLAAACAARPTGIRAATAGEVFAYVGGYTPNAEGITLCRADLASGRLTRQKEFPGIANPSWLALGPDGSRLYACNEVRTFRGAPGASVSAFAVDRGSGELTLLDVVSSGGTEPAHLSVHPSGKWLFVANYRDGRVALLPVRADGGLGEPVRVVQDRGPGGPPVAVDGPPGAYPSGDSDGRAHAHMAAADPTGRFVLANDLGLDRLYVWRFDPDTGALAPGDPPFLESPPGSGPRHFAFHPNGRVLYNVLEEASRVAVSAWGPAQGRLAALGSVSTLPEGYAGSNLASGIAVSADGRFVYVANRLHNTVAVFATEEDGRRLRPLGHEWVRGDYPRHIVLAPGGGLLFSCNQRSDNITAFRVDPATGSLAATGSFFPAGSPACLVFLA